MSETPERKFVLTKIEAGDYLLPSNDEKVLWRIRKYIDGPSLGLDDWPSDREVWALLRWTGPLDEIDPDDDSRWDWYEQTLRTRAEAIEAAMQDDARRTGPPERRGSVSPPEGRGIGSALIERTDSER